MKDLFNLNLRIENNGINRWSAKKNTVDVNTSDMMYFTLAGNSKIDAALMCISNVAMNFFRTINGVLKLYLFSTSSQQLCVKEKKRRFDV